VATRAVRGARVAYEPAPDNKPALYRALLPAVNSGRVELLDHPRLTAQLTALERRVARAGTIPLTTRPVATMTLRTWWRGCAGCC